MNDDCPRCEENGCGCDLHGPEFIHFKWVADGASTLSEAADMLRKYADWLVEQERGGWRLYHDINDGIAVVEVPQLAFQKLGSA